MLVAVCCLCVLFVFVVCLCCVCLLFGVRCLLLCCCVVCGVACCEFGLRLVVCLVVVYCMLFVVWLVLSIVC